LPFPGPVFTMMRPRRRSNIKAESLILRGAGSKRYLRESGVVGYFEFDDAGRPARYLIACKSGRVFRDSLKT
jgi:hypothetical protein